MAAIPEAELSLLLNLENDAELLREFVNESQEHLQNIELGVLVLEDKRTDAATLNSIFRAFHTFKGGSGLLNLTPINHLAHELESLLDLARQQKLTMNSEIINLILEGGDVLKQFIHEIGRRLNGQSTGDPLQIPTQDLISRVRAVVHGEPAPVKVMPPAPASVLPPTLCEAPAVAPAAKAAGGSARQAASADTPTPAQPNVTSSVKVDILKLDSLIDLVGELVIGQSLVTQDTDVRSIQSQHLARNLAQVGRITNELQRTAMSLRMVPIRPTFQKMQRLVRDLAARSGKQVQLTTSGEETELDRTIVEVINDPICHMVRNSVDHGLEKPEVRLAAGKTAMGNLHLHANHQGGNIVIEIRDDGAGLNVERIMAKAIEKGRSNRMTSSVRRRSST